MKNFESIKRMHHDSLFTDLFTDENNIIELYHILLGDKAKSNITADDIKILTLEKAFIHDLYNDLCFMVDDELIILMEAQSTYTKNIVTRLLFYLARDLEKYIRTKNNNNLNILYKEKMVELPTIKLYTIYTGERELSDHTISLKELMKDSGIEADIDLRVKVFCDENKTNILSEYIKFCKVLSSQKKKYGNTREAVVGAINICKDKGILKQYLKTREHEVIDMICDLVSFDQWVEDMERESEARGKIEGKIEVANKLSAMGMTQEQIGKVTGLTKEELKNYREYL